MTKMFMYNQPVFNWIDGLLCEMKPMSDTPKMAQNLRLGKMWVWRKTYYYSDKEYCNKMTLNVTLYSDKCLTQPS